jgi:hypothetical protein
VSPIGTVEIDGPRNDERTDESAAPELGPSTAAICVLGYN